MSESENENNAKEANSTKTTKFQLRTLSALKELDPQELWLYVEKLHELLRKNEKKLRNYKAQIKKLLKQSDEDKSIKAATPETHIESVGNFVAEIREAAEQAQNLNGFVYEPTSGLYYDQKTGYYYNAEYGLYYDGNTGCYYNYNQQTNAFEFHSQVQVPSKQKSSQHTTDTNKMLMNYVNNSLLNRFSNLNINRMRCNALDIAKKYPPSLRIIVQETNLESLKVGNLSLITYKGGSLGREGNHDVIIPDVNVSKTHLKFQYDHKRSIYKCIDLGSRNGTMLNGSRMSATKIESNAQDLVHGSVLQIAQTKLLCHVHEGNSTCGLCEPGLLIETAREIPIATASTTVALTHKEQLKKLQKKYGLENEKFVDGKQSSGNYNDRAATRRTQVGSSTDGEKTQTASVNTEISSENKGFKMLSKLGWSKGETLGKSAANMGLLEPINVSSNEGKRGLGCDEQVGSSVVFTMAEKRRIDTWKKTQVRYQQADIFADSDDEDETT